MVLGREFQWQDWRRNPVQARSASANYWLARTGLRAEQRGQRGWSQKESRGGERHDRSAINPALICQSRIVGVPLGAAAIKGPGIGLIKRRIGAPAQR